MPERADKSLRALLSVACLLGFASTGLVGCNSGRQLQADLYTRELRLQEDEIYRLEDCLEEYQAIIRSLRQENQELKQGGEPVQRPKAEPLEDATEPGEEKSLLDSFEWSPDRPDSQPSSAPDPPQAESLPDVESPAVELPSIDLGDPAEAPSFDIPTSEPTLTPPPTSDGVAPTIEVPGAGGLLTPPAESLPAETLPAPLTGPLTTPEPLSEAPRYEPAPLGVMEAAPMPDLAPVASELPLDDQQIEPASSFASILEDPTANQLLLVEALELTAHAGPREQTGEATLVALVTPTDAAGQPTLFQGEAALMLRDATKPAGQATLVRWDFTASEVASAWRGYEHDPKLDFALVLPTGLPTDAPLELWVRLIDTLGHKHLVKMDLTINDLDRPTPTPKRRNVHAIATAASSTDRQSSNSQAANGASWRQAEGLSKNHGRALPSQAWRSTAGGSDASTIELSTYEQGPRLRADDEAKR